MAEPIGPGLLVRDDHDRLGIIAERTTKPSSKWLREQLHPISNGDDDAAQWWEVMPLEGGVILSPESLLTPIRPTTYEDFLTAVEGANLEGRKRLAALFPAYVERACATVQDTLGK